MQEGEPQIEIRPQVRETIAFADQTLLAGGELKVFAADEQGRAIDPPEYDPHDLSQYLEGPILDLNDATPQDEAFVTEWMEGKLGAKLDEAPVRSRLISPDGETTVTIFDVPLGQERDNYLLSRWQNEGEKPSYILWQEGMYEDQVEGAGFEEIAGDDVLEREPRDAGAILAEVGLNPEALQGKTVLYFGSEPLTVEGAEITTFDLDFYLATDELGIGENGVDYVIAVGDPMLQDPLGQEDREELLAVVVMALKPATDKLRIAKPYIDPQYADSPEDGEVDYERAIENITNQEFHVIYDISDAENPYLSIQAVPPKS